METVIACLTPPGSAAIATLGIHGPRAVEVTRILWRGVDLPENAPPDRLWFGQLGGDLLDQVVATVPCTEPIPQVELHCHGGREVVQMLLETFAQQGVAVVSWQEWLQRTTTSLVEAEVQLALAHAPTTRTASLLFDQASGRLEAALQAVAQAEDRQPLIDELLRWETVGSHLTQPWRVVVAGPPNVGKSSLVNAIAGYQRCVVSEIPGTTRDIVTTRMALDGWPVELIDTAGLRLAEGSIESEGVRRAQEAIGSADLCLWLLDGAANPVWPGAQWGAVKLLINKIDQPPAWEWPDPATALRVSAGTGAGIAELCQAIVTALVPTVPPPGTALPITMRQVAWLRDFSRQSQR